MEVQIRVEIQDTSGKTEKRLRIGVPEDITQGELISGLREHYPNVIPARVSVYVEFPDNRPSTGNLITEGALIIIRPRSSGIRVIDEE